jgi:hypothetical protein
MSEKIESITQFIQKTQAFATSPHGKAHLKYWYRGQADATWTLTPKLYRTAPGESPLSNKDTSYKEREMMRNWRLISASIRTQGASDGQLYFLAQHYGMPTRLLDWTTNPLIALYFACSSQRNTDGKVFMLNLLAWKLPAQQPGGAPFGVATGRRIGFIAWMDYIFNWRNDDATKKAQISHTFPVRPELFDLRISLQQGCFTFHHPNDRTLAEAPPVQTLDVPRDAKEQILGELAALNINHFSVFGDLEALAKHLSENWKLTPPSSRPASARK